MGADRIATLKFQRQIWPSLPNRSKCSPFSAMESGRNVVLPKKESVMGSAYTVHTLTLTLTTSGGNVLGFRKYKKNNSEVRKRCKNFSHSNPSGSQYILGCFGLE